MATPTDGLTAEFKKKVTTLLANCKSRGIIMKPTDGVRTPLEQAKLWRQSRTTAVINAKIKSLKDSKADFLAKCLEDAGPWNYLGGLTLWFK